MLALGIVAKNSNDVLAETYEGSNGIWTIGLAEDDAEIIVNGEKHQIDEDSFVLTSGEIAIVCDTNGDILEGEISRRDYDGMLHITSKEMSQYDIRRVVSQSSANVRSSGEIRDDNIISAVPSGDYVLAKRATTPEADDKEWLSVLVVDGDNINEGYMREDVISEIVYSVSEKNDSEEIIDLGDIKTNNLGTVTGIDISSSMPSSQLRELLQNGIPSNVESSFGNYDTSNLAGEINYVYIKIGASGYGKGKINPLEYDAYIGQVEVCEELGIPYGFYYYSTAITEQEAQEELECIEQRIKDLRQRYNLKYNMLEIALDVELHGENDRQYKGDIKEQTRAKAEILNGIIERGLSDNVLLYSSRRTITPNGDQIIDLEYLMSKLSYPEKVSLWQSSLMHQNGEMKDSLQETIDYAESYGMSNVVCQLVLDTKGEKIGDCDINSMEIEHFLKLTKSRQANEIFVEQSDSVKTDAEESETTYFWTEVISNLTPDDGRDER